MIAEDLNRSGNIKRSSDRSFGFVFAGFFSLVGLLPLIHGDSPRRWAIFISVVFLAVTVVRPALLSGLNRLWHHFGLLLHKLISPVALATVFYLCILPVSLLVRLQGKDLLRLKFDNSSESYWILRVPPGPDPKTMINQF